METFLELDKGQLDITRSHSFPAPEKHGVLAQLNQQYVADLVNETVSDLMASFFPS